MVRRGAGRSLIWQRSTPSPPERERRRIAFEDVFVVKQAATVADGDGSKNDESPSGRSV